MNNPSLFENTKMNSFVVKGNFIYSAGIHSCTICPISGEHGEGFLKVDVFNKNTLSFAKSIDLHAVKAYDLKAGISLTSNNELLVVSAAITNTWQWLWGSTYSFNNSCGSYNSTATLGNSDIQWWSSDALIAKIDLNDNVEWLKIFDAQNIHADFPQDIRNEECLYNITEGPNGDIVAVGNCSKNLDDDYIVCLSNCQDNTDPSDCFISLRHIRNDIVNHDYVFTSNENWIGTNKVVTGRIIVETGATLTIKNSTVLFTPNSRTNFTNGSQSSEVESYILVKPGGTLIIDNSTLKAQGCGDQFWRGILVEGCGSDDFQPPLNQVYDFNIHDYSNVSKLHPSHACAGKVIITPGSILMNARTAVYSGSFVGDWDDTKTGGIVISDGATFLNNHRDVGFVNYTKPNISYFKNTKFESNNYNDRTGLNHVTAWNVDNIVFEACDFMANNTNNPTFVGEYIDIHRGVGIYSIDAKIKVKPTCQINSTTGECLINGNYKPSTFTNLYRGIDANGSFFTDLTPNIQIGYAKFLNCSRGVHLQGMMYPVVGHSIFGSESDGMTQLFNDRKSCHMFLQGCSSYLIEDNYFNHEHWQITNPLDPQSGSYFLPYGLVVNNANTKDEKIYRNTFEQLLAGAGSVGLNGKGSISSTDISGLQWLCNGFVDNNNDINTFTGDGTFSEFPFLGINPLISNIAKIRPQQGRCAKTLPFSTTQEQITSAANNIFTDKPFNNTGYNWLIFGLANEPHWDAWANPVADNYQYNFTANIPSMEPVLYKLQLNKNVCVNNIYNAGAEANSSCPRTQPQSLFLKKLIIDEFKVKTLSAKSVIDGTVSVEDYWRGLLANATDENIDDIVSSLAELDYVSPALLVDVIHNSHAGYAIQDIYNLLVQNSSIPQSVLQALVDSQLELTEEQIEDLINEQMQESPFQGVVNNYTYYNTKWQLAIDDLARTFIDSNLIDSAINLYIQHGSESSLQQAVPLLVQTQQYGLAQSILNNLVNIDSPFYASVSAYFNLLIDCKTNGISVFNIDTPKINQLKEIAAGPSYVAYYAISLLEFITGQEFVEHIPNLGGEVSNKTEVTKFTKNDLWKQIKRKNAPLFQAKPNPAVNHFELVVYSDQNEKNDIECSISDMRGQLVQQQRFVLQKGYNYLNVDASNLSNGLYQINIQGIEINLQTKVIISK